MVVVVVAAAAAVVIIVINAAAAMAAAAAAAAALNITIVIDICFADLCARSARGSRPRSRTWAAAPAG